MTNHGRRRPKAKATPTEFTGGAGFTYEDTVVVACYLAALLRRGACSRPEWDCRDGRRSQIACRWAELTRKRKGGRECGRLATVIPGRAQREPQMRNWASGNLEIPGPVLRTVPE